MLTEACRVTNRCVLRTRADDAELVRFVGCFGNLSACARSFLEIMKRQKASYNWEWLLELLRDQNLRVICWKCELKVKLHQSC